MKKEFDFTGVPEKDIEILTKELLGKINYIASGRRDAYLAEQELEKELLKWGRAFVKELKEQYGLEVSWTSFTYWEIPYGNGKILVPFNNRDNFKSIDDFRVFIKDGAWKTIGEAKSVEECVLIINKYFEELTYPCRKCWSRTIGICEHPVKSEFRIKKLSGSAKEISTT